MLLNIKQAIREGLIQLLPKVKWNNPSPDRGSRNENLPLSNMYRYVVSRKVSLQGEEAEETDQDLASTPVSGQRLSVDVPSPHYVKSISIHQ